MTKFDEIVNNLAKMLNLTVLGSDAPGRAKSGVVYFNGEAAAQMFSDALNASGIQASTYKLRFSKIGATHGVLV